ncbi:unnamed protein product [Sphagnum jensenii]|uniref:Uncharacterized protein n=1 Tax=Sphagnum jensenii TaxID=128206 RepID=A0ABP0VL97_9BRYO
MYNNYYHNGECTRRELERILAKGFFMLDEIMDYECSSFLVQFDHAFQHTYQHISSVKDDTSAKRLVCYGPHGKQSPIVPTSSCRMPFPAG